MGASGRLTDNDPLDDFACHRYEVDRKVKAVFVSGSGPPVIVLAEMPGITPDVARFARWVREGGFTVYLPHLFGEPGAPSNRRRMLRAGLQICISREFHLLRSTSSGPLSVWLRGLAQQVHQDAKGRGVGVIGMCVTGNFALSMVLEEAVLAPVLAQPSLPVITDPAGMHISPADLAAVTDRLAEQNLTVLGYRFDGDRYCRKARFDAYQDALGVNFVAKVLPSEAANVTSAQANPHSVFTRHLIDAPGELTRAAVDEVIAFFIQRLCGAIPNPTN